MRNPLKRHPSTEPKPSLRERAAALRASAGQIMRPAASSPAPEAAALPAPGSDEARVAFAEACREHSRLTLFANDYPELKRTPLEWWTKASLSRAHELGEISADECARLYPIASDRELRMDAISHRLNLGALHALAHADDPPMSDEADPIDWHNPPAGFMAHPAIEPGGFLKIAAALPLEAERLSGIAHAEFERRCQSLQSNDGGSDHAERIAVLRRTLRVDAWAAVTAGEAGSAEPAGDDRSQPGFVLYEDAAGTVRREPVAGWIGFMARRLYSVAKGELERGFNAACASEADQDSNALYDRLRRELRVDALFDLAYHSREVFEASQGYAIGARRRYEGNNADLMALGRDLDAAHMTWRQAVEANREPSARYMAAIEAAQAGGGPSMADFRAAQALPGVMEATDAEETAFETVGELALALLKLPARTLADLAVQARAVIPHVWASGSYEKNAAPDADETIDKEVVRSLIESCCAAAGVDWRGAPVGEALSAGRVDPQGCFGDLLSGLDLSAMSMRMLSALHDHVETLSNICYGLAAQPRSLQEGHRPNEAGLVLFRLIEGPLQKASDACLREAKRRDAVSDDDRDIRVAMVSRQIIENDDPDEILALTRDLLAMVKV